MIFALEAKKITVSAISSATPNLFNGMSAAVRSCNPFTALVGTELLKPCVMVGPGAITFTLIFLPANSLAATRPIASTAAFVAEYTLVFAAALIEAPEEERITA